MHSSRKNSHMSDYLFLVALGRFSPNIFLTGVQDDAVGVSYDWSVQSPPPQRQRISGHMRGEVVKQYKASMSTRWIAGHLGIGRTTVLKILKEKGVKMRPRGRRY